MAWRSYLYVVPTVPFGSEVVVTESGTTTTVMLRLAEAVSGGLAESFTCAVKLAVPEALGVPLMVPVEFMAKPAGNVPLVMVQAYGWIPPVA